MVISHSVHRPRYTRNPPTPIVTFASARIRSVALCAPENRLFNFQSQEIDGYQVGNFNRLTGITVRKLALRHQNIADLAVYATKECLVPISIKASRIDALVVVTQSSEMRFPAEGQLVARALGLNKSALVLDINAACAGYVQGLFVAHSLVGSGTIRNCLLICGDTLSRYCDPKDAGTALAFSDGVSATYLTAGTPSKSHFCFLNEPEGFDKLYCEMDGKMQMQGQKVMSFVTGNVGRWLDGCIKEQGSSDFYVWHQAGEHICRALDRATNKVSLRSFQEYGNLSSASIPSALVMHRPTGYGTLCGFGAGFSAAQARLNFTGVNYGSIEI